MGAPPPARRCETCHFRTIPFEPLDQNCSASGFVQEGAEGSDLLAAVVTCQEDENGSTASFFGC